MAVVGFTSGKSKDAAGIKKKINKNWIFEHLLQKKNKNLQNSCHFDKGYDRKKLYI